MLPLYPRVARMLGASPSLAGLIGNSTIHSLALVQHFHSTVHLVIVPQPSDKTVPGDEAKDLAIHFALFCIEPLPAELPW